MVDFLSISQNIVEKKALKQYNVLCIKTYPEGNIMIFKSKEQDLMFMNVLWLRLFYLQEHLKENDEFEFMQVVREYKRRCSNRIDRLKYEI